MENDLDTVLRHHYRSKRLSSRQLSAIEDSTGRSGRWFKPLLACSSVVMLTILLLMPAVGLLPFNEPARDMLFADIIKNHMAGKPVDFRATDFDALTSHLANSGLHLRRPELLNFDKAITGARLCSLAGQPAIQIYFNAEHQERTSLFIAKAEGALENPHFSGGNFEAMAILTWAENGHFYALAKDSL